MNAQVKEWLDKADGRTAVLSSYATLKEYADGFLEIAEIATEKLQTGGGSIDSLMPAILYNI